MSSRLVKIQKRQALGGVTSSLSSGGQSASNAAQQATGDLSKTQLIGLSVGLVAIVVLVVFALWWCCTKTARRDDKKEREAARRPFVQLAAPAGSPYDESGFDQGRNAMMSQVALSPQTHEMDRHRRMEQAHQMPPSTSLPPSPSSADDIFDDRKGKGHFQPQALQHAKAYDAFSNDGTDGFGWGQQQPHYANPHDLQQVHVPPQHRQAAAPSVPPQAAVYLDAHTLALERARAA
ncbi:hypothetical protein FA10DRAFT_268123 [Acaromyces ingoldii]|uniref:Uncharacterized protein n=1 Tax=Acaromyces ingoldii TaxID=215250 RepID=A0A316YKJ5_9BASI|nr:hypothetical protein FA10DRAFT_268123 [Acaromyces ingoldii]PWN89596.1 hypothetical protein FA10DRAFT_268123 [Acaromyces ingoldii]